MEILIFILKWLKKWWPEVLLAVVVIAAVISFSHIRYSAGYQAGASEIQKKWNDEKMEQVKAATLEAARRKKLEDSQAKIAKEIQDGLQKKLDDATDNARSLSERLRVYQKRRCATPTVSQAAGSSAVVDGSSGVAEDSGAIGEATDAHFAACARDAEKLKGWQDWYNSLIN